VSQFFAATIQRPVEPIRSRKMQCDGPTQKFRATPWLQESVPHCLICRQAGRRRHPTLGQAQKGITSMRDEDRAFQVEIVGAHPAVSAE
jgi:hypothetical protein